MLGNISKKKGDNGDFYTKAVVDKKIKDAETAVRAYTDKAAADAKNDLYAEVGEKVDKVEGKGLVDKVFADDVSTRKAALGNGNIAIIDSQLETYSITTRLEAEVAISGMDDSGNTVIKHKLSEKADKSDVFLKSSDVVLADGKKISADVIEGDTLSLTGNITTGITGGDEGNITTLNGDIKTSCGDVIATEMQSADGSIPETIHKLSKKANTADVILKSDKTIELPVSDAQISLGEDSSYTTIITSGEVTVTNADSNGYQHKLTEKLSQSQLELYLENSDEKQFYGGVSVTRNNDDADIKVIIPGNPNTGVETTVHKLSEKANAADLTELKENTTNIYNSCGGFAAGEGAEVYGTPELGSGEIGLIGDIPLNAIQLGGGTNDKVFTMKVYDYELVVDGASKGSKSATDGKKYIKDVGKLSDLTTTDKSSVVAAINEVKSIGGGDVLDNLTYDSTNDIINSDANLLLTNTNSVAAYNGTFRGDIKIGQLGANKWAYTISPITGFSTSVDVTCTSGNVVHNLSAKADTTNVLTRNNTQTFTPTGDYQPATKKYVDDLIAALRADLGLE